MRKRRRARWGSRRDKTVEFLCFFLTNRPFPHIVSLRIIRVLTIKGGEGMKKPFHLMIFRVYQSHRNHLRPRIREIGLSSGQPKILLYVRDHRNCRLKDVARHCEIKPATTSRIIDKLVEDGYVTKTLTCDDRRAMCLCITRAGEAALEKWVRCCVFVEEEMLRNFSEEERRQFYHYLDRAYENLNGNQKEVALCEN